MEDYDSRKIREFGKCRKQYSKQKQAFLECHGMTIREQIRFIVPPLVCPTPYGFRKSDKLRKSLRAAWKICPSGVLLIRHLHEWESSRPRAPGEEAGIHPDSVSLPCTCKHLQGLWQPASMYKYNLAKCASIRPHRTC